ncbi:MAG: glycosyltransferase family 39 protein [Candidatus Eremiobacteraeota bacterium]|nr:glycosyltransferase family 39 protein [Candidatus Eremiobacteraeota bacterium]
MNARRIPLIAALVTLAVHLIGNPHYGFFRDELYFIICGFHPAWGYVDQPPIVPLLAAGTQLFGHSLFLLRAVPATFAAGGVYVTCLLVIEMGGGAFAQAFAALTFLLMGVLLSFGGKVGPDEVGLWTWPLAALYILRIVKGGDQRLWLAAGLVLGFSLESKYTVIFFAIALLAGVALAPQRRLLASRLFFGGAGVALLIALPNVIWQALHGLPMWELLRAGQSGKNTTPGPLLYLFQEIVISSLTPALVWIAGLIWLLRERTTRFLGFAYAILILEMMVLHGKHYYPADVYPILIAAGGVAIEAWIKSVALRTAATAVVAASAALVPFSLPILDEKQMVSYATQVGNVLHISRASMATEHHRDSKLPSDWADMHGWPELAATVAEVYNALPPAQRKQAVIAASNYGEAAAIDFFGKQYGLPPAISGHNNYWLWGTHGFSGNVVIDVNGDCGKEMHLFRASRLATTYPNRWGVAYEMDVPVLVCTGITRPLAEIWPSMKDYQ